MLQDKNILVRWNSEKPIKTIGHKMPDGWWYIFLPDDQSWHYIQEDDVTEIENEKKVI